MKVRQMDMVKKVVKFSYSSKTFKKINLLFRNTEVNQNKEVFYFLTIKPLFVALYVYKKNRVRKTIVWSLENRSLLYFDIFFIKCSKDSSILKHLFIEFITDFLKKKALRKLSVLEV